MHHKSVWRPALVQWLPLALTILLMSGLVYVGVQQNYRQSANDPQVQIAEDISAAIKQGTPANNIVPPNPTVDISSSLSAFAVIFDDTGKPIGSSVALDGQLPTLPSGVFDKVKKHGQDVFTWQPKKGVRIAAVVLPYSGSQSGYVLAGRSLKEIEKRESALLIMCAIGAAVTLALSLLLSLLLARFTGIAHFHSAQSSSSDSAKEDSSVHHHSRQ